MNKETAKKMGDMRLYGMQTAFNAFIDQPPTVSLMMRWPSTWSRTNGMIAGTAPCNVT